jgi:hypothetical protein
MRWKVIVSSNRLWEGHQISNVKTLKGRGNVHELESDIGEIEGLFGVGQINGGIHDFLLK